MRIASFNIHGAHLRGRAALPSLLDACRMLDADIIGLQEVDRRQRRSGFTDQAGFVARRLGVAHVYGPTRRRIVRGQYGNALITRGTIVDADVRRLPGTGTQQRRVAILARVRVGDDSVSVAVTHLQHHPKRLHHLPDEGPDQLRALLGWLKQMPTPRALIGDLNLQPARAHPMLEEAGFEVAITGPAFPSHDPTVQLDYIAVDGMTVKNAEVVPVTDVSDHRPIVVDVSVGDR